MPLCSMNSESEPRAASSCGVSVSKRPELRASAPTGRVEIIYETSIRNIPFGKHIVRQSFQLGERHVLHGMLYLANQLVSLVIVIIAQA